MYDTYINAHSPVFKNSEQYLEAKLKILRCDFCIKPTQDEIIHLKKQTTQIAIDNAIISIINSRWG